MPLDRLSAAIAVACLLVAPPGVVAAQAPDAPPPAPGATEPEADTPSPSPPPEEPDLDRAGAQLDALRTPGGMTADEAARRAVQTAPSIEQSRAAALVAEAGADRAWLGVLPRIDLSASYMRLSDVNQPSFTGQSADELNDLLAMVDNDATRTLLSGLTQFEFPILLNQYAFRASVSYPVTDLFLTVLPGYRAARTAQEAQQARIDVQQAAVALDAREAFYSLARARGSLLVAEAALAQAEAQQRQVDNLVRAGAAARVDALRVQSRVASARVAVARARGGVKVAERGLRTLLHLSPEARLAIGEDLSDVPPEVEADPEALIEKAKTERAEVKSLRLLVTAREREARAEAGRQWPRLTLRAGYDLSNPNPRVFPQTDEFRSTWEVGAVLSWSPNDMLDARAAASEARARARQVEADLRALEDAVELEVVRSYEDLRTARQALEAARTGIEAAEENYRVRFRQLQAGAAVTSDLVDADAELTRARLELIDAAIDLHLAHARLERAVSDGSR